MVRETLKQNNVDQTICVPGYAKTVRPPVEVTDQIKTERMATYGDSDSPANYELDHLIPLEVGGCPDCVSNLWPEPYSGDLGERKRCRRKRNAQTRLRRSNEPRRCSESRRRQLGIVRQARGCDTVNRLPNAFQESRATSRFEQVTEGLQDPWSMVRPSD